MPKSVIIVGGGAAGIAAAASLASKGVHVRLFESRPFLGGRIYSFTDPVTGDIIDNGQHLFAGFYNETFKLLSLIDSTGHIAFQKRLAVEFIDKDGKYVSFKSARLPSPLHFIAGLFGYKKFPKKDIFRLIINSGKMKKDVAGLSAADFLAMMGQSEDAQSAFYRPLVLATLNADLHEVSAKLFSMMLKTILSVKSSQSVLAYSTVGLSELIAEPAGKYIEKSGGKIHTSSLVREIQIKNGRVGCVVDESGREWAADDYILALPPDSMARLVSSDIVPYLDSWSFSPIVSVNIWFDGEVNEKLMLGLLDAKFHWFFNKKSIIKVPQKHRYISLLASSAYDKMGLTKENIIDEAVEDMNVYFKWSRPLKIKHAQVISERRATVLIAPGMMKYRPKVKTGINNLYLAGDWVDTGLPATIESAVKSGFEAANCICC